MHKWMFATWISICCMFVCVASSRAVDDGRIRGDGIFRAILEDIGESGSDSNTPTPAPNPPPATGSVYIDNSGTPSDGGSSGDQGYDSGQGSGENTSGRDDFNPWNESPDISVGDNLGDNLARDGLINALRVGAPPGTDLGRPGTRPQTLPIPRLGGLVTLDPDIELTRAGIRPDARGVYHLNASQSVIYDRVRERQRERRESEARMRELPRVPVPDINEIEDNLPDPYDSFSREINDINNDAQRGDGDRGNNEPPSPSQEPPPQGQEPNVHNHSN